MKLFLSERLWKQAVVAPHAGAWIETIAEEDYAEWYNVAPHAGAWIETDYQIHHFWTTPVAPHAGAWIETVYLKVSRVLIMSPPTRGRGLKHAFDDDSVSSYLVAPHAGAWIETS